MSKVIKEIMKFQTDRELHLQPYNPGNEHVNIVEELLESVGFDVPKENRDKLRINWQNFVFECEEDKISTFVGDDTIENIVDAYADIIVFAVGAITKLGYDPESVLKEVAKEINSRTGKMVNGKFEKDLSEEAKKNWYKADFSHCLLISDEERERRRRTYFDVTGHYGSEKEIDEWFKSLE